MNSEKLSFETPELKIENFSNIVEPLRESSWDTEEFE